MPAYNSAETIRDSIASVIYQSYPHWRLYIIDDASSDNTAEIVHSFCEPRLEYIRQERNGGVAKARNVGIKRANGIYIAFLDSDDIWELDKLQQQLVWLENGFDIVCSNYGVFDTDPKKLFTVRTYPEKLDFSTMLRGNCVGNLTGIYNQQRLGKIFQKSCGHEDYIMWLELIRRTDKVCCVQRLLARYRRGGNSLSSNKVKAAIWQWKIYRQHLKIGIFSSLYYWLYYVVTAIRRSLIFRFEK
ncbi:glycosyltransferase [Oceanisphaera arctica]|uniref:Glycosyltransferase n=2 Tax=Oceanisphaera arctica TaxID=641510 RepID=A0A2P5TKD3_9GAMM|nr:glycosyltransferase [Oceanisphaera arctica]